MGDSGDEQDQHLLGNVGQGEDDYYDPDMDDLDQQFVDNRRRRHLPKSHIAASPKPPRGRKGRGTAAPPPARDAAAPAVASAGTGAAHGDGGIPGASQRDATATGAAQRDGAPESTVESVKGEASMRDDDGDGAGRQEEGCASSMSAQGSAPEWRAYVAPSGHEYYHNSGTGETTWVKPDG